MTKEFISRKTAGSFQKTTSQFAPRPFATPQQKSAKTENSTPQDIQCLPESSNRLSRIAITQPETFTPQLTVQRAEQAQGANDNPGEEAEKIQRASTGNNRLTKISIQAPEPPSTPRFPIQAKLTVGAAGDKYEQEADRVARQVVNRIQASQINLKSSESNPVQRKISIQALGGEGGDVSSEWESQLNQARSGGQPLSPSLREPMEREFGADFSGVRVHTGAQADGLARSIQAKAFTTGKDVFFRQGAYEPGSRGGQELIAHELTHVVQQRKGEEPRREELGLIEKKAEIGGRNAVQRLYMIEDDGNDTPERKYVIGKIFEQRKIDRTATTGQHNYAMNIDTEQVKRSNTSGHAEVLLIGNSKDRKIVRIVSEYKPCRWCQDNLEEMESSREISIDVIYLLNYEDKGDGDKDKTRDFYMKLGYLTGGGDYSYQVT